MTALKNLSALANPCDLLLIVIFSICLLYGICCGFVRTIFRMFRSLAVLILSVVAARICTPWVSTYLVMPIVGDTLQNQISSFLQRMTASTGATLSEPLQMILGSNILQSAGASLQESILTAAQHFAESIAFSILLFFFMILFSVTMHMLYGALRFFADKTPLKAVDRFAGAVLGGIFGAALCVILLWGLYHFAPALFTELGVFSPTHIENSLLTRFILGLFQ